MKNARAAQNYWVFIHQIGRFADEFPTCFRELLEWCQSGDPVRIFPRQDCGSNALNEFQRKGDVRICRAELCCVVPEMPVVLRCPLYGVSCTVLVPSATAFMEMDRPQLAVRLRSIGWQILTDA